MEDWWRTKIIENSKLQTKLNSADVDLAQKNKGRTKTKSLSI